MTDHNDEKRALNDWSHTLSHALQILDLDADAQLILDVAKETSRSVGPSAGPISAFYVGYAAALAATSGHVDTTTAVTNAAQKVMKLCAGVNEEGPEGGGWADTAQ
ncbi:DUF6457 domain-containing protein [Arthrobacter sp.]|uniref:DUF6457 domain-containing protein n=1 Tax=Arthrobacter sp. TaxID=1667 RepID=UPI0026DFC72A|nr:DUF6457 domain-containing protein [Arthrobacter sp.]MDO5753812.1 DUF6457 domain-containing protein [Arthrobacter sp.]